MLRTTILAATLSLAAAAHSPAPDLAWRATDHKKLGKEVAAYFEAYSERKGISEALEKLFGEIDKLQKRAKGVDVLSYVDDWQAVFREERMQGYKERPRKGKVFEDKVDFGGLTLDLAMRFPDRYTTREDPYPLVLIAPPSDGDPMQVLEGEWTDQEMLDKTILCAVRMPTNAEELGTADGGIRRLMGAFSQMLQNYAVDMNRVFVAGHGNGSEAAARTAAAFPMQFAGLIVRGGAADVPPTNFRNLPSLWMNAGDSATSFEQKAKEMEIATVTVSAGSDPAEITTWIADKVRDPYPQHLTFTPAIDASLSTNWLRLEGASASEEPFVEAKVDRDSNTITVDVKKAVSVVLYLNDVLVDMDKPVKVVLNGTAHEALVPRNRRTMLELAYGIGDWGRVFTATESFDVGE